MNKQKYQLFPTLVTRYERVLSLDESKTIHDYCIRQKTYPHYILEGNSSSSHQQKINGEENLLQELEKKILKLKGIYDKVNFILNDYAKDMGIHPVVLSNNWFNIQGKGSILRQHIHCHSVLSASLYLNVDKDSSSIYFENPNSTIPFAYDGHETSKSEYLFEHYYLIPDPGDLIIFPSWLKHGSLYTENKTKNRTCISMNSLYRGGA